MSDEFDGFHEFDDFDEDTKRAELICKHKREKLFPHWMQIAFALDNLESHAAEEAGIERDESPDYVRDHDYQAEIQQLKEAFPSLLGLTSATRKQLSWLVKYGSQLYHWYEKLPADYQAKLTNPSIIRNRFEADD